MRGNGLGMATGFAPGSILDGCSRSARGLLLAVAALVAGATHATETTNRSTSILLVRFSMPSRPFEFGSRLVLAHCDLPYSVHVPMRSTLQQFTVPAGRYYVRRIETRFWIFEPFNPRPPTDERLSILVPAEATVYVGDFHVDDSFRPSVRVAYTQDSVEEMLQMIEVHRFPLKLSRAGGEILSVSWTE